MQDLTSQDLTSAAMMASAAEASTDPAWTHTMVFDVPERADALVVQLRQPLAGPERPSLQDTARLQTSSMHKESLLARVGFSCCPCPNYVRYIQRTIQCKQHLQRFEYTSMNNCPRSIACSVDCEAGAD